MDVARSDEEDGEEEEEDHVGRNLEYVISVSVV